MMGGLAGVLGGGVVLFVTRDPSKAMSIVAKGTGVCAVGGILCNVAAYVQTHRNLFTGSVTGGQHRAAGPADAAVGATSPAVKN